jgi:hypothetical protein
MGATPSIDAGRVHSQESAEEAYFFERAGVGLLAVATVAGQAFEKRAWHALPKAIRYFFCGEAGDGGGGAGWPLGCGPFL